MEPKAVFHRRRFAGAAVTLLVATCSLASWSSAQAQSAYGTSSSVYDSLYGPSSSTSTATLNALESQSYGSSCDPNLAAEANAVAAYNEQRRQTLIANAIVAPSPMSCLSSALSSFSSIASMFNLGGVGSEFESLASSLANNLVNQACVMVNNAAGSITGNFYDQLVSVEQTPFSIVSGAGSAVSGIEGNAISSITSPAVNSASSAVSPIGGVVTSTQNASSSFWSGFFQ
jgi:hypothetical protein